MARCSASARAASAVAARCSAAARADRAAAYVSLGSRAVVASLRRASQPAKAYIAQAEAVIDQLLEEARLGAVFREQEGRRHQVGFGREADDSPYGQWGWEELN